MAGVVLTTSFQSVLPNQFNGSLPSSQQVEPPRTPRVPAQVQRPPPPPETVRIPTSFHKNRVDILA